jgi:hypothetical protein
MEGVEECVLTTAVTDDENLHAFFWVCTHLRWRLEEEC